VAETKTVGTPQAEPTPAPLEHTTLSSVAP
jgi:hypothetical protein